MTKQSSELTEALLARYFDDQLSASELESLQTRLNEDVTLRKKFVELAWLHDQLRSQLLAASALNADELHLQVPPLPLNSSHSQAPSIDLHRIAETRVAETRVRGSWLTLGRGLTLAALAASLLLALSWWRSDSGSAQAGQVELLRLIAASRKGNIVAYKLDVESSSTANRRDNRPRPEDNRPPKPPMDGAALYIGGVHEFVLVRKSVNGGEFIMGCDGQISWAMRPDGPVRVSHDLDRFNHDVPGHEFSMPLCNVHDALRHLQGSFTLTVLPTEYVETESANAIDAEDQPSRLLVATKNRGYPGPRRVEITYQVKSGQIDQLRFVGMPYGPDRLTLRLSRVDASSAVNRALKSDFFKHESHHDIGRQVIAE